MAYETLIVEKRGSVGLITLNRPDAMNALSATMLEELTDILVRFQDDADIGAIVLTGSERAFAAGADIKEMADLGLIDAYTGNYGAGWESLYKCRKPTIAAVAGYALGGGCELAMMCDFIIAADSARFGQPEITLGIMPGMGGTQRLTRAIGKAKAMEMCLTGRMMDASEAESSGLVSRVVPVDEVLDEALKAAEKIASFPKTAVMMVKEAVNNAEEAGLSNGLLHERRLFHALFATSDQEEGMAAFVEKREPQFKNE